MARWIVMNLNDLPASASVHRSEEDAIRHACSISDFGKLQTVLEVVGCSRCERTVTTTFEKTGGPR